MENNVRKRYVEVSGGIYNQIKKFDSFPKVAEEAETSKTLYGGIISFITFSVMIVLLFGELFLWLNYTNIKVNLTNVFYKNLGPKQSIVRSKDLIFWVS